ncbi:VWA domain-containing protein [Micromonospora polyrhachis]|uniref:Mg-chelatase subunit ChlD n=1 Tax=Micromonospora polyrhachis TaxID=1282883 RepID=A0A7W7WME6_9ACTN|nr:VWA domain-containing protein [Micromonospora polyrhachis]MBB4956374.1 Mg-chelatase subunit ChlD [Micromonospora polyrhachis]
MAGPPAHPEPTLERWRLVLGPAAQSCCGDHPLSADAAAQDAALGWLYGRDKELTSRDIRGSGVRRVVEEGRAGDRQGGSGASVMTTVDWLDEISRLFPKETIERLERDAVERYDIHDVVTNPVVLERIAPNPTLLKAVLRTKYLMSPDVLQLARQLVDAVVRELVQRLATEVRRSFAGARSRRSSRFKLARDLDLRRTVRANLANYQTEERKLYVHTPYFVARDERRLRQWQVILLVDQSGSMAGSVIHSAVTAACLWGLPGVKVHLVTFDTTIVDLTEQVQDPVELLMRVQLGGGTDIARAVGYGASLIDNPRRTIVALITDFFEGGDAAALVRTVRHLVEQGTTVLGLAALDEEAEPAYERGLAQQLADVGAHIGAMTPGELATFVAEKVGR